MSDQITDASDLASLPLATHARAIENTRQSFLAEAQIFDDKGIRGSLRLPMEAKDQFARMVGKEDPPPRKKDDADAILDILAYKMRDAAKSGTEAKALGLNAETAPQLEHLISEARQLFDARIVYSYLKDIAGDEAKERRMKQWPANLRHAIEVDLRPLAPPDPRDAEFMEEDPTHIGQVQFELEELNKHRELLSEYIEEARAAHSPAMDPLRHYVDAVYTMGTGSAPQIVDRGGNLQPAPNTARRSGGGGGARLGHKGE